MLTAQHLATIEAALHYWQDEMCPHATHRLRPYFKTQRYDPLTADEVADLRGHLRRSRLRYALYRRRHRLLQSTELFSTSGAALRAARHQAAIATVLLPRSR